MTLWSAVAELAELIFPRTCVACGLPGFGLCAGCQPAGSLIEVRAPDLLVTAAAAYDGPVRSALLNYKERARRDLVDDLARLLARSLTATIEASNAAAGPGVRSDLASVLVPVPSTAAARRVRGGDHLLRLSRRAAVQLCGPTSAPIEVVDAVALTRRVRDGAGLSRDERARNLHRAMRARPPGNRGGRAVLVDDIVTTGASLSETARALREAGWDLSHAAVIAATPAKRSVSAAM